MNRSVFSCAKLIILLFLVINVSAQTNLITNGTFENSLSWTFLDQWGSGDGTGNFLNGGYQIEVIDTGSEWWHIQLYQSGITLEQGKRYQISFDAYSDRNTIIQPVIFNTGTTTITYLPEWYSNITTTETRIDTSFTMTAASYSNCTFSFDCGLSSPAKVWIDNVTLYEIPDNRIPDPINYPSPTIERRPTLSWHPGAETVSSFTIQLSYNPSFPADSLILIESTSDTFYTVASDLPIDEIFWRVRGDDSFWSELSYLKVNDARIPKLISPNLHTYERRPTLRWHVPPVAVSGYTVQVASDGAFSNILAQLPVTDTVFVCATDLPVGDIYWRVKADDSEYSFSNRFRIIDSRVPMIYEIPNITDNMRQPIAWNPIDGASSYTIQLAFDNMFDTLITALTQSDTLYIPLTDLPVDQIYCRVKSDLLDEWSPGELFMVLSDTIPVLFRFDNAILTHGRPEFRWKSVTGATSYKLEYADNISFTGASVIPLSDTTYTPGVDLAEGFWYWRVSSSRDFSVYSLNDYFSIDLDAEIPVITSQPQNATKSEGESVTFSVAGASVHMITYEWFENGIAIENSNSVNLTINNLTEADSGNTYYCILTNKVGSVVSETVVLNIEPTTPITFQNVSNKNVKIKLAEMGTIFTGNSKNIKSFTIVDMRGRVIHQQAKLEESIVVGSNIKLSSGSYLLRVKLKNGEYKRAFIYTK